MLGVGITSRVVRKLQLGQKWYPCGGRPLMTPENKHLVFLARRLYAAFSQSIVNYNGLDQRFFRQSKRSPNGEPEQTND